MQHVTQSGAWQDTPTQPHGHTLISAARMDARLQIEPSRTLTAPIANYVRQSTMGIGGDVGGGYKVAQRE